MAAFGCEELQPQSGQHISISDGVATITCDTTGAVQEIRCVDSEWEGEWTECETGDVSTFISLIYMATCISNTE